MSWYTKEINPGNLLIEANIADVGVIVVGSINEKDGRWFVEIMWSGPGGDYKADFGTYLQALAYIHGVGDAHERLP